ncbi:MAG: UvrD-helicase domain-containing protein [Gammaproteobacteria bacterium]
MTTVPDAAARERALDVTTSFVVQAPAGSGKTSLLTQRLLKLLTCVRQPEQVLAITFTRKAAEEMRARIIDALDLAAGPLPEEGFRQAAYALGRAVLEHDAAQGWELRAHPSRLRIMTIDALCQSIVRQAPISAGLPSAQGVEEDASRLYAEAAREAIAMIATQGEWRAPVARLLAHFDNDWPRLESLLAAMLARRDQWLPVLRHGDDLAALEACYRRLVAEDIERVLARLPADLRGRLVRIAAGAGARLAAAGGDDLSLLELTTLRALPGITLDALGHWHGLARLCLTAKGEWRKTVNVNQGFPPGAAGKADKDEMTALLIALGECDGLARALARVLELPRSPFDDAERELVAALLAVLRLATAMFDTAVARGRVDFTGFALAARAALGAPEAPSDLALALDYRLQHLLIDEVQDTSASQYALIEALTVGWTGDDGRSLFLVGDPMQSIYRFRQAEVELFTRVLARGVLGELRLERLALTANFRAQANLVEWINDVMPRACATVADFDLPCIAQRAMRAGEPFARTLSVSLGRDAAREAREVRASIEAIRARAPDATIALLVRSRAALGDIPAELIAHGHALAAREIEPLASLPCIGDLLALCRALLHEGDAVAWHAVLRAPWCGVTLATLHALAQHPGTLREALAEPRVWAGLPDEEAARLARLAPLLAAAHDQVGREPFASLVERCWVALGGPAVLEDEARVDDVRGFFALLAELETRVSPLTLEALGEAVAGRYSTPPPAAGVAPIQIMTVHRAKGLEFDHVIVPGCGAKPRGDDRPLLAWRERRVDDELELLLAPSPAKGESALYDYLCARDREAGEAEAVRVLYVALTRAKHAVHLFGHVPEPKPGQPARPSKGSFLAMLWPAVEEEVLAGLPAEAAIAAPMVGVGSPPRSRARLDDLPTPHFILPPTGSDPPLEFDWAGTTAKHLGTVAHRLLQALADGAGLGAWSASIAGYARGGLRALGVPQDVLDAALAELERAVAATRASERGQWLFSSAQREVETELCLAAVEAGRPVRVIIDRTFVDHEGRRWIVDFKTGSHRGGAREAWLDSELTRYRPQLERYARIMAALDPRPIMLGLYFPLVDGWREWAWPPAP